MKLIAGVLTGLMLLVGAASAQADKEQQEAKFKANYAAKLKKEFLSKVSWETTFAAAKTKAKAENKLLLGYFTRSYAN